MREALGTTGEAHALAEVIASRVAVIAMFAHDACLNCDALTRYEICHTRANRDNDACGLVAEDEGGLDGKVAIPPFQVIVN